MFTTIFRTGGTERFTWFRGVPASSKAEALQGTAETRRGGYVAFTLNVAVLDIIGLPTTYEPAAYFAALEAK